MYLYAQADAYVFTLVCAHIHANTQDKYVDNTVFCFIEEEIKKYS